MFCVIDQLHEMTYSYLWKFGLNTLCELGENSDAQFSACKPNVLKGTRCLGSVELVLENSSVTVCCKMYMVRKIL